MEYIPVYNLEVYQLSEKLSDIIWFAYDSWDYKSKQTLGLQIIRSADSIAINIAEGYGRFGAADRKRFYIMARGSFEETKGWLRKAIRRNVISNEDEKLVTEIIVVLGPKLNAFIKNQNIS